MPVRYLLVASLLCVLCCVNSREGMLNRTESSEILPNKEFLLLLDVSASMQLQNRKYKIRDAVTLWIENYAPNGIILSIMKISTQTKELHGPITVDSESRKELIRSLPIRSEGESCISCGIQQVIEMTAPGTVMVIITDGEVMDTPEEIQAVKGRVEDAHMKAITIILGNRIKDGVQQLGASYQVQDKLAIPGLISVLQETVHSSLSSISVSVPLLEAEVNNMKKMSRIFYVDSTSSDKLCMSISSWPADLEVFITVTRPDGKFLSRKLPNRYYHSCRTNPMVGQWKLDVVAGSHALFMSALVTTENDHVDNSIQFQCFIKNDADPPSVYALLKWGEIPVRGATVIAELWLLNGTAISVPLFDNGVGTDAIAGDGIYSRYIPPFLHHSTWISAFCQATGKIVTENNHLQESINRIARSKLSQITTNDSTYPPAPITDLQFSSTGSSFVLTFTSSGSELDWGQALKYQLLLANITQGIQSALPINLEITPKDINNIENVTIQKPQEMYLAIRVIGRTGLSSKISNIVQVYFDDNKPESLQKEIKNLQTETLYDETTASNNREIRNAECSSTKVKISHIIYIVIGIVLVIIIVLGVVVYLFWQRKKWTKYNVTPKKINKSKPLLSPTPQSHSILLKQDPFNSD